MKILWPREQSQAAIRRNLARVGCLELLEDPLRLRNPGAYLVPVFIEADGALAPELHEFLYEKSYFSGGYASINTIRTYAESLVSWIGFTVKFEIEWRSATVRNIAMYRNFMKGNISSSSKKLSAATINLRLVVVTEFYKFLWVKKTTVNEPQAASSAAKLASLSAIKLRVNSDKKGARALTVSACDLLCQTLSGVHQLIFLWSICTGMRTSSVLGITVEQFVCLESIQSDKFISVLVKGGRKQRVYVPDAVILATRRYIDTQRLIDINSNMLPVEISLFVNTKGRSVTRNCYYSAYKRAAKSGGLISHPHQARTTFATFMEKKLQGLKDTHDLDPVKVIQGLLGHASASTTQDYLESIAGRHIDVLRLLETYGDNLGANHAV